MWLAHPRGTAKALVTVAPTGQTAVMRSWRVLGGLCLFVVGVYLVVVLVGGALIGHAGSPQLGLSVLATALVALAFEPVQNRLERFGTNGAGTTPYDVVRGLSDSVTGGLSSTDLPGRMAMLLAQASGAERAQVWLLVKQTPVLAATWPPSSDADLEPPDLARDTDSPERRLLPVRHAGELLALLRVQQPVGSPMTPLEDRLFTGLAAQAGLVLHSIRLRAELAARRDELAARGIELSASRQRLIETQDGERIRLERDIHDGAQQHLVALAVNLRLAETLSSGAPDRAAVLLGQQADASREAINLLVRLSRGIYPQLLTDKGLVTALRAAVAVSPIPITINVDDLPQLTTSTEAALYFCCMEAVQNAAKHSRATGITVTLRQGGKVVSLTVSDDGEGFDPAEIDWGTGLQNKRDRIDSAGGTLDMRSARGRGTQVEVSVPTSPGSTYS